MVSQKSPYLQQHAYNPVDWFPWEEEALAKAAREQKPIFLSIGYSTCHWCHVMERESFEDEEVASYLNSHYIAIKVDREERPDLDKVYMKVCQVMSGQGGWPLTIISTPGMKPFFAGTYLPKRSRYGMPGLMEILESANQLWHEGRGRVLELSEQVAESASAHFSSGPSSSGTLTREVLDVAYEEFSITFDEKYGGFGRAPKFPSPHNLLFLLRLWHLTKKSRALEMVEKTLDGMHRGGIYDHVGFGFSRYSTDGMWLVPHFEKMLYDNALLAYVYLEAYQATGKRKKEFAEVAKEMLCYIDRVLASPEGGFYSAEDADSEGIEGKFYKWTAGEVTQLLGEPLGGLVCKIYGFDKRPGDGIPNLAGAPLEDIAKGQCVSLGAISRSYEEARAMLFQARELRTHPFKDEKILTSWNGLMISALSKASVVLGETRYADRAAKAADFILSRLRRNDGRLLARYSGGEAAYPAYLDDYAYLVWGLLELYEASFKAGYLKDAVTLNQEMLRLFWDSERGGLYFTGSDAEALIARPKEAYDGATPSGNSVAAMNLLRLARMTGDDEVNRKAEALLAAFSGEVSMYPSAHASLLTAFLYSIGPTEEIVVAGDPSSEDTKQLMGAIRSKYLPNSTVLLNPGDEGQRELLHQLSPLSDKQPVNGKATIYVCKNCSCRKPGTLEDIDLLLSD